MLFNTKEKDKRIEKKRQREHSRSSSREEAHGATRGSVTSMSDGKLKGSRKRDVSADIEHNTIKENGHTGTPILTHPSENIAHTYSFDIGIPHSHKNFNANQYSLSSLQ